ncbi:sugar ABC transporter substrate-binding protein [Lachnoclostridium sp. Marseille-P6806]|uniref:sugar ABC transporter substrate-binding protein n=1 Tax=Lachnoclostridium sp. Marseille-P6806 TaxID=2364793 RepID=UPI00102F4AC7|nr:sugar ABC transporter substrate-binding protein [Lachnoclostridium sp. Marseille-P6806]
MRKKQFLSLAAASVLALSALAGCGNTAAAPAQNGGADTPAAAETGEGAAETAALPEANHDELYTVDFYDVAANFQGIQPGWYGKIVKDKFNMELNIISPQVSGDGAALYQTRTAAGALGDLVILDNAQMQECVDAGLIYDLSGIIEKYPNLMKFDAQIDAFNKLLGDGTKTYAIPLEMNNNGPTAFRDLHVYSYPRMGWDMYQEAGAPDLKNMDDLLDCLEKIQKAHPMNEKGDPAYAISLWPDWDSQFSENVAQIAKWYGQEVNGSVLIGTDNSIVPLTDEAGSYYRMCKFLFDANQRGLVDPDSATQDWNAVVSKMQDKRIYLYWYSWQYGFWNSPARGEEGVNYVEIPVADTNLFQTGNTYYGDGRVIGVGAQVSEEKLARLMEFLDWYASPEGAQIQHAGTEGLIYTVGDDGKYVMTDAGLVRFAEEVPVPEDQGGGNWNDGNNMINQWIVAGVDVNPDTGEPYSGDLWASTIRKNQTKTTKEWSEKFGAPDDVHYLADKGLMTTVASINIPLDVDTTDISLIRKQCGDLIKDTSWKMVFAANEEEFKSLWEDMCTKLNGFGWDELVKFDTEKYTPVIEARKAAAK